MLWKLALFQPSGKVTETNGLLTLSYSQSLGTTDTVNSLRDAPENGSSPRVVTVKWLLKN